MYFSANTTYNDLRANTYHPAYGHKNGYLETNAAIGDFTSLTGDWIEIINAATPGGEPTQFLSPNPPDEDDQKWWQHHQLSMPDGHTLIILESEGVDQDNLGTNIYKLVIDVTGIGRYYYLTTDDAGDDWNSDQYRTGDNNGEWPEFVDGSGNSYITLNKLQYGPLIDASGNLKLADDTQIGLLQWYQSQFWTRNLDESKSIGTDSRQNRHSTKQFGNEYTFPRKWDLTCVDQINFSKITY